MTIELMMIQRLFIVLVLWHFKHFNFELTLTMLIVFFSGCTIFWHWKTSIATIQPANHTDAAVFLCSGEQHKMATGRRAVWHVGGIRRHVLYGIDTQSDRHQHRQVRMQSDQRPHTESILETKIKNISRLTFQYIRTQTAGQLAAWAKDGVSNSRRRATNFGEGTDP